MNREGQWRKGKETVGLRAVRPPYTAPINCDTIPWKVVALTCPIPHCPLPIGGVVYMVRGQGDPTALIPCDFVLVGCGAVWGFTLLCLFPLSYFLHA